MQVPARRRCRTRSLLCTLLALTSVAAHAAAAPPTPFGDRSDAQVSELVNDLGGFAQDYRDDGTTGAVLLEKSTSIDAKAGSYAIVHNRVLHAFEAADEHQATQSVFLDPEEQLVSAKGWIVRTDGSVSRLADRDVRSDRWSKDGPAEIVLAFPKLEEGDTIGFSVVAKSATPFFVRQLMIDDELPVAYGRFVLQLDGTIGYSVKAFNVRRDDFQIDTPEEKNGNPSLIVCTYRGLAADRTDVLGLPWRLRRAHVLVNYKGSLIEEAGMWRAIRTWNEIALFFDELLRGGVTPDKTIRRQAKAIITGQSDSAARANALYRFVRDEIVTLDVSESRPLSSAKKILEARAGDTFDKAGLLVAMMRSVGLEADRGFARSLYEGKLLHDDPGLWQFTDALVRVLEPGSTAAIWFVPGVDGCPPRTLPPSLRGVEVVFFEEDLKSKEEAILRRVYGKHGDNLVPLYRDYLERIRMQSWSEVVSTAGNSAEIVGIVDELRVVDVAAATETVNLTAQGICPEGTWARTGTPAVECAERYNAARGLMPGVVQDAQVSVTDDGLVASFVWSATLQPLALATEAWVLPPELVFGASTLAFWKGTDRGPILVPSANRRVFRTEIVLPEGWQLATEMDPLTIANPLVSYECHLEMRDGRLVVERTIDFKAGALGVESLTMLDDDFRRIIEAETSAIVVRPGDLSLPGADS